MQPNTKRLFTAVAASLMSFSNITPVMAESDDAVLNGDLLVNGDTGTDVVSVGKEDSFDIELRLSAGNIANAYSEAWDKQNADGTMNGVKASSGSIFIATAIPISATYVDASAMSVKKDGADMPAASYSFEDGLLLIKDSIAFDCAGKTKDEIVASFENFDDIIPTYTVSGLTLTEEGKKTEQMFIACNSQITLNTTFTYDWEGHADTEDEANALLATLQSGTSMESFDGPGFDVTGVKAARVDVKSTAAQTDDGAFNGDTANISAALTALDETDYIKNVKVVFTDVDSSDTDLSAYMKSFTVDTRTGLDIDLSETVKELTGLGYVVGEYPTKLSGAMEQLEVKVRHDHKTEKTSLDPVTITRSIIYECEGKQIGSAEQSVTATPVRTDEIDAVTKEVLKSETSDDDITFNEVKCANIEGYTPTQSSVPAATKKLSEWQAEGPIEVRVEYVKTDNESEKNVDIIFVDESLRSPQDLSEYNKTVTVKGKTLPDGSFLGSESVPVDIEDTVKHLVESGYTLVGKAPKTVNGSADQIIVHFTHNSKSETTTSEKPFNRSIILHVPGKADETITQESKLTSKTIQIFDAVTNELTDTLHKYSAHLDEYNAPKIGGYEPDIKTVPAFDADNIPDEPNAPATVEITYKEKEAQEFNEYEGYIVEVVLEDDTPVKDLGGELSFVNDPDARKKFSEFDKQKRQEILDAGYEIIDEQMRAKSYLHEHESGATTIHTYIVKKLDTAVDYVFDVTFEHETDDLSEYNTTISKSYKSDPGGSSAENDLNKALEGTLAELKEKGYTLRESSLLPGSGSTDKRHHIKATFHMVGDKSAAEHTVTVNFKDTDETPVDLSDSSLSFTLKDSNKPADFDATFDSTNYELIKRGFYIVDSSELDKLTFAEDETATVYLGHLTRTDETITEFRESDKNEQFVRVINMHFDDGREDKQFNQYGSGSIRKTVKTDMVNGESEEYEELMSLKFNKLKVYDIESAGGYIGDLMEIPEDVYEGPLPMDTEIKGADVTFIKKNVSKHNVFFAAGPQLLSDYTLTFDLIDGLKPADYEEQIKAVVDELTAKGYIAKPYDLSLFSPQDRIIEVEYNIEKKEMTEETDITRTIRVSAPSGCDIPAETVQNGKLIRTYYHVINHTTGEEWDVEGVKKAVFPEFTLKDIDGYVINEKVESEFTIKPDMGDNYDVSVSYEKISEQSSADAPKDNGSNSNAKSGNTSVKSAKEGNANTGTGAPIIPIIGATAGILLIGLLIWLRVRNKSENKPEDKE